MNKPPLKKIKMMDIMRKKPTAAAASSWKQEEEQVKFTIERKTESHQDRHMTDEREDARRSVIVETAPLHDVSHQDHSEARGHVSPEREARHFEERAERAQEVSAAPRMLHEDRPEHHSVHREEAHPEERQPAKPEVTSLEMDRPIAYIPKEKPTREEKRVLERIEKRERSQKKEPSTGRGRGIVVWIASCLLLGLGAYVVVAVLPRAEVALTPKTVAFEWVNAIGASTKIADIDPGNKQIPVAVFSEKKTNAFQFPATGSGKSIERKATGKITIYNEFNGSTQPLVAGTRFETPDGKIFRLKERVTIPGAKTEGGELVPASIEVDVVADKAGEAYNISPVKKFTIPGFKGTPKYDTFYGSSKDPMTGGFIGEGKYPTADDIKAAKESAERQMKGVIESFLATQVVPEGFKTIESSRRFKITKETVNEAVDEQGNFSVYIEAEGGVDTLKEEHVLKLMTALAREANEGEAYEIREHTLSYGDVTVDEKAGTITLPIQFKGVFWKPVNVDEFKKNAFGKDENELKSYIFSSTNIEKADISLWPVWVRRVPSDTGRVKVELK